MYLLIVGSVTREIPNSSGLGKAECHFLDFYSETLSWKPYVFYLGCPDRINILNINKKKSVCLLLFTIIILLLILLLTLLLALWDIIFLCLSWFPWWQLYLCPYIQVFSRVLACSNYRTSVNDIIYSPANVNFAFIFASSVSECQIFLKNCLLNYLFIHKLVPQLT